MTITIAFNQPFAEALQAAAERGVVLPDVYYGELQGIARQLAFSIAGLASLDQLQQVKDSLDKALLEGQSFGKWKKQILASGTLDLPTHRLDNIFRTNIQSNYMAGKWERFREVKDLRPYLMYDAINDSRVRPAHLALDGIIRRVDDPFWATHSPVNGYRCRCTLKSLSEQQALDRSKNGNGLNKQAVLPDGTPALPDKGWDYNPGDRLAGVERAIQKRDQTASPLLKQALDAKLEDVKPWPLFGPDDVITNQQMKDLGKAIFDEMLDKITPNNRDMFKSIMNRDKSLRDLMQYAEDVGDQVDHDVVMWLRDEILEKLRSVRSVGNVTPSLYQKSGKAVSIMRRVASKLPDEWIENGNTAGMLDVSVSKNRGYFSERKWNRSSREFRRFIRTSEGSTAEHEFMHHIQFADKNLDRLFSDEHRKRTATDPLEILISGYPDETGKPDGYVDRYQGREYSGKPLEVITMAFQAVIGEDEYANNLLAKTLKKDRDMLHLTLGTLFHYKP